ncbi:MAG: diguanylate cyclase (GGDEF)-like protein [Paraglaciecola sp.]|jgi:diguanylate cyclase (GGDEF)-like protein
MDELTVKLICVLIALQFLFACVFFYEKNRNVKGIGFFAKSALFLLLSFIFSSLYSSEETRVLFFIMCSCAAFSYYYTCKSFIELLAIRVKPSIQRYWLICTLGICLVLIGIDVEAYLLTSFNEIAVGIIPFTYLSYLVSKKLRYSEDIEEAFFLSGSLQFVLLGHLFYLGATILPIFTPTSLEVIQFIPDTVNNNIKAACLFWILFSHISLLISFLIMIFKFKERELKKMNETDFLTGIYNRKTFFEKISMIPNKEQCFFIMIDADFFKKINDNFGHLVGDEALKHIVETVKENISGGDIFARYGGEEFIIAISNITEEKLKSIVERIRYQMEINPLIYNGLTIPITLSIGVSKYINDDSSMSIKVADEMLYMAKENGRNQATFSFT